MYQESDTLEVIQRMSAILGSIVHVDYLPPVEQIILPLITLIGSHPNGPSFVLPDYIIRHKWAS